EELQRHLWQGTTFVDFEQGLNTAVNRLRQALGDSADQPRYIETLPGRGYRFVAAVQNTAQKPVLVMASAPAAAEIEPAAPLPPPVVPTRRKAWPLWIIAAGVLAGLAG